MMKKTPPRYAALRKELVALRANASKKPGEARWRPIVGLSPETRIKGKRYEGWICKKCGDRLELGETPHEAPEPVNESFLPWVKCHCGRVDRYRWNARTSEV
jgi:hypothetical protein